MNILQASSTLALPTTKEENLDKSGNSIAYRSSQADDTDAMMSDTVGRVRDKINPPCLCRQLGGNARLYGGRSNKTNKNRPRYATMI